MVGMLLLLLLSRFSHVKLCATPSMEAHQAPPSQGFSKQEHWSGVPFPSPMHKSEKSFIHGIFQARVLEWVAIAFKWNTIQA